MASPRLSAFRSDPILREADEPTFWLDKALRIAWVNRAWERLTGYSADQILAVSRRANISNGTDGVLEIVASHQPPTRALDGLPVSRFSLIARQDGERFSRVIDFLPFHRESGELLGVLGRIRSAVEQDSETAPEVRPVHEELVTLRERLYRSHGIDSLVGRGLAHERLLLQIRLAASSTLPVLILGEQGTGKRTVASAIHHLGPNRRQELNFIEIEAFGSEILQESLLDVIHRAQVVQESNNGDPGELGSDQTLRLATLVLGDILLLPRDVQASVANRLHKGMGVRLIALTAGDPEAALQDERLRPDFYFGLTSLVLRMAPLRDRRDEILLLAQHFLDLANRQPGPRRTGFAADAQSALLDYDWPGNLTELARVVNHARGQKEGALISANELPTSIRGNLGGAFLPPPTPPLIKPLDELLTEIERRLIENALVKARRNKTRAADLLGISRPRLYRRMKELNLAEEEDSEDEV